MEVLASIESSLVRITNGASIQLEVPMNGNEPEDVEMHKYEQKDVHNVLSLLLCCDSYL